MNRAFADIRKSLLAERIEARTAVAGVIGLGYVGLPLAAATARSGFRTIGFDVDESKLEVLGRGRSYIEAVSSADIAAILAARRFEATTDFSRLSECDVIVVCVPTPLSRHRDPDLRFVEQTTETIATHLQRDQLVVVESTTYPGTTEEVVRPILESGGLRSGEDFFLAFSPEREDPGNKQHHTTSIPKVVAGDGAAAAALVEAFYAAIVERVVPVSAPRVAEAVKITENVFRAVNIALVNELKIIYDAMGIDVWEVIEAAATKPFGYMPFYPGPGLGGHCIPIDPFYLTWKSREYSMTTKFIELAGEINVNMPRYVVSKLEVELDRWLGKSLGSARILVVGLAYKKNVPDVRESPSFVLMELLEARGTRVDYHDPHVPEVPPTREHQRFTGRRSVAVNGSTLAEYDAVLIATDHDEVDYEALVEHANLIVDTRNAFGARRLADHKIVKA